MSRRKRIIQETEPDSWKRDCYDWLQMLTFVLVGVVLVFTFLGMVIGVSGTSMYPTLHHQDIMVIQRVGYTPAQGDVVVLRKDSFLEEAIVKRVIAVAGQEVEIDYDANTVYVDGVALDEPYINQEDEDVMVERSGMVYREFTVPKGCIFVMGDNRNGSTDSRYAELGMVDTGYVLGRALCVAFPFSHIQSLL
ncbi:MAG: signal peptidase I [Clostridiales bacterium]|jgi:signal peptidase I|nr:MAG: signal peptidase I [Clostridiales bacterium]